MQFRGALGAIPFLVMVFVFSPAHAEPAPKPAASATLRTQMVEYKHGDAVLEGFLALEEPRDPARAKARRPAVIVVHEWWGLNDYAKRRAEQVARLGYVVLAADIYGKGIRADTPDEAGRLAGRFKGERGLLRGRAQAALDFLRNDPRVDPTRIACIGYCFGGTTSLELARSGESLAAVVSFHGGLDTPKPEDARHIKARVLVLHGAEDPFVSPKELADFQVEMRNAGVDYQVIQYGNAVHSFTNPDADAAKIKGAAYNGNADRRSWEHMRLFLQEAFVPMPPR